MDIFIDALRQALRLILTADPYVIEILLRSLRVSGTALFLAVLIGVPAGVAIGAFRFKGRRVLVALVHTGFALPPVVVGLFVYMLLSESGPAGRSGLLFTPAAMMFAQAILAAPYVAGITLAAVQAVPIEVRLQALALGASRRTALWMQVREARLGLIAAIVAGFGAILSEVGAVMMVGGNIANETRVMTTAIVLETRRGNFGLALALGLILLGVAFGVNVLLTSVQQARTLRTPW